MAPRTAPPPDHHLILYDFEASPWCRLVREYATILDLTLEVRPCPRETLFYGEGAYGPSSRFRPEAMDRCRRRNRRRNGDDTDDGGYDDDDDHLTFPLLVDRTNAGETTTNEKDPDGVVILTESYEILSHLWDSYGQSVIAGEEKDHRRRPDQVVNAPSRSFGARFLSLAGPSYLRPWPRCGLMRLPSRPHPSAAGATLTLYQAENCPDSRLVREVLCGLEVPYRSVPMAEGSSNALPEHCTGSGPTPAEIPVLRVETTAAECGASGGAKHLVGADDCVDYLVGAYYHCPSPNNKGGPSWFDPVPGGNLGRDDGRLGFSVVTAAISAVRKGREALVPERAME